MAKQEKGTHDAFELLVNSPYYWSLTGNSNEQRRQAAFMLKNGKGISLDRKEELLNKAGFGVKQEKIWILPEQGSSEPK